MTTSDCPQAPVITGNGDGRVNSAPGAGVGVGVGVGVGTGVGVTTVIGMTAVFGAKPDTVTLHEPFATAVALKLAVGPVPLVGDSVSTPAHPE